MTVGPRVSLEGDGGSAWKGQHRVALLILVVFCALGIAYSVVNPLLESMDEIHHYGYIQHLTQSRGLPVQRPGEASAYEQEGSQPPLYYVLGAALTAPIDPADSPFLLQRNPQVQMGVALAEDNHNALIHTEDERWPWHGEILIIHLVRLFSVALGAGTVWGAYRLGTALFPDAPAVPLGAMALTAFNPQFVFLSSSINNDNLITCLATWILVAIVHTLHHGVTWRRTTGLGVLLGLAVLSKVSGLGLIPVVLAGLAAAIVIAPSALHGTRAGVVGRPLPISRTTLMRWVGHAALALGLTLTIGGWWYLRNHLLYGEYLGIETMLDIFGRRDASWDLPSAIAELRGFRVSYWGLFGSFNVMLRPTWALLALEVLMLAGSLGVARSLWRAGTKRDGQGTLARPAYWLSILLLLAWIVILHLSLLRWTSMTQASQGRLVFPAIAASSLLVIWGLSTWFPPRWQGRAVVIAGTALFLLAVTAPWTSIAPAYAAPPRLMPGDIPASAERVGTTYGEAIRLLAVEIQPAEAAPGGTLRVSLYWQALRDMDVDYWLYLHLRGRDGAVLGQRDSLAGMGTLPTSRWQAGNVMRDTYTMHVSAAARAPVAARLTIGLYDRDKMLALPFTDGEGKPTDNTLLARIKITGRGPAAIPGTALDHEFDAGVRLIGYDMDAQAVAPGEAFPITLYWEAAPLDDDYTVFVHLVAEDGRIIGQGDGPPLAGDYPTTFWGPGERLQDVRIVQVEPDAPPGVAHLYVGLYELNDGHRLGLASGASAGDTRALVAPVAVSQPLSP